MKVYLISIVEPRILLMLAKNTYKNQTMKKQKALDYQLLMSGAVTVGRNNRWVDGFHLQNGF